MTSSSVPVQLHTGDPFSIGQLQVRRINRDQIGPSTVFHKRSFASNEKTLAWAATIGKFLMLGQNGRADDVPETLLPGASRTSHILQRNAFLRIRPNPAAQAPLEFLAG
ncbi:MAG: hypothetical protein OXH03_11985 [Bacteroidetes bacterium]|nr:hypothetical protein [Bacteroidota bacterium]MXW84350.1 hypothetical protein [Rhodothermaceae bacterium]MDE2671646.1 hypothetical protein [Bacteroidota bacterium]MXX58998.1 hypothetical protein [Rhodothermaceae bacterium]MYD20392.1 hypothetical protein [Rhodothermaceae bacterium]